MSLSAARFFPTSSGWTIVIEEAWVAAPGCGVRWVAPE